MPQRPTLDGDQEPRAIDELRERAEHERDRLRQELERAERERDGLRRENDRLKRQLEDARRAAHRQAAPFAKPMIRQPRRPGTEAGVHYGPKAQPRRPSGVDERHAAPLPGACPDCGAGLRETRVATQFQEELPVPRIVVREFRIHIGACRRCGRRVQGRHPLQTSDALGAGQCATRRAGDRVRRDSKQTARPLVRQDRDTAAPTNSTG